MARLRLLRLFPGVPLVAGAALLAALAGGLPPELEVGVVIEKVQPGSVGEQAGFRPGDVLLDWQRAPTPPANPRPAAGTLRSPFDLTQVLIEQLPRGALTLRGWRGWRERTWFIPGGSAAFLWGEIETRPALPGRALSLYLQGKKGWSRSDSQLGDAAWRAVATQAEPLLGTWLLSRRAEAWSRTESWDRADSLYRRAIVPLEARGDAVAAQLLRVWGRTFLRRGSWEQAESCFERALAIDRRLAPRSLVEAWSLTDLGYTASRSAGSKNAETFFNQALELRKQLAPGSAEVAASWYDLGADASMNGAYTLAGKRYRRALDLQQILTPEGSFITELLTVLGLAHYYQQDYPAAEKLFQRALTLAQRQNLEGLEVLATHRRLGEIAERHGDLSAALWHLGRAVDLAEKIQPGGWRVVEPMYELGLTERRAGRWQPSGQHLCEALEVGERQSWKWRRNDEERIRWSQFLVDEYRACTEALVHLGRSGEAFATLERGRARAFLALLAERPLRSSELPPNIAEKKARLAAEYDQTEAALERMEATEKPKEAKLLRGKLREIRRKQDALLGEIRGLSPSFAALHASQPVDLAGARQALDSDTVLLSYSVGDDQTLLFVVEPAAVSGSGLQIISLPIGRQDLQEKIYELRGLLQDKDSNLRQLLLRSQALYELLLEPAEPWLAKYERILVCPDGSLHSLPFAVLMHNGRYLIQWRPLHITLSATAYADLKREARPRTGKFRVAAFGDPLPGPREGSGAPLRASRREVEKIASLFSRAQVFLGAEATEERVKQVAWNVDLLHLAVHAKLDELMPFNSALVLSPPHDPVPGHANGRLQVWEIVDSLHLRADLVTLSACETALGRQMDGEGLAGLSRAFQIAGARSVLAALWAVSDVSTARFMQSFYGHLRHGAGKDRTLQAAQVEQIRSPSRSHPFHWAAFQLYGSF